MDDLGNTDDLPPVLLCDYGSPAEMDWLRYASTTMSSSDDDAEYRKLIAEVFADEEEEFEVTEEDVVASVDLETYRQALALLEQIATARGETERYAAIELAQSFIKDRRGR